MGYERPMYFKLKKPQSLDMGFIGQEALETAAASQETLKMPIAKTETFYRPPWFQVIILNQKSSSFVDIEY